MAESRGLKALENWAKKVTSGYNGVNVTDMASSFRDGLAFCAIIHHYYPDLIDFESLSKENILHNNSLAFSTAEKQLGIPALLDAEDMVKYAVPDRLSIITYLSQLYNCLENQNRVSRAISTPVSSGVAFETVLPNRADSPVTVDCYARQKTAAADAVGETEGEGIPAVDEIRSTPNSTVNRVRPAIKRIQTERPSSPPAKLPLSDQKSAGRSHELCHACKHRVFILERLMVSGKLYHRTCFKCCKCDAILKPGAYVESDNPGTYECAVCPRDEKKRQSSPERKKEEEEEQCHKDDTEAVSEVTLVVSPPPKPQRALLSSKLNSARNTFLQESMQNGQTEGLSCEVSINGEMSSHDSFSMNMDQALGELEGEVEAVRDDQIPEKTSRSSSLSSYGSQEKTPQDSASTEHADEKGHKPYQSIFTREALHLTPLKSSIVPKEKHPVSSTLNSLYGVGTRKTEIKQSNYDIPFVRPSSQSDAAVTPPRRSSIPSFQVVRRSNTSGSLDKGHSEGNISSSAEGALTVRGLRTGSLDTASADVSGVEERADCGPLARPSSEQRKSSEDGEVVLRKQTRSSSFSSESSDPVKPSQQDPGFRMSVKELIRLREASIHEAATSASPTSSISKKRSDSQLDSKPEEKDSVPPDQDLQSHDNSKERDDEPDQGIIIKAADDVAKVDNKVQNTSDSAEKSFQELNKVLNSSGSEQTSGKLLTEPSHSGTKSEDQELYPDELNPFGDEEDGDAVTDSVKPGSYPDTLNPFGDDDDDNDNSTSVGKAGNNDDYDDSKNPFASDDDDDYGQQADIPLTKAEPSKPPPRPPLPTLRTGIAPKSPQHSHSSPSLSSMDSPTGSIVGTHKKRKAPQPPHVKELFPNATSDSSPSAAGAVTPTKVVTSPSPKILKSKRAPPPPSPATSVKSKDFSSLNSISAEKFKKDEANMKAKSTDSLAVTTPKSPSSSQDETQSSQWKKKKRPAPPVPIPSRREIKKIPLHQIQAEMNEIEEKQIELEKQGRDLEVLIRDRDKDEEPTVEEEEYIMQLFELVNQKNALFRRQAELMYIKRSQRLEEEQVELEYEIRCLMMKPASQKTDEDKTKEEELVQRLLDVVDQRNEIIDSIEMDRKREFEEDVTVQEQMEIKNSDLPITAEIKKKQKKKKKNKEESKSKKEKKKKEKEQQQSAKQQQHGESGGSKLKTLLRR